MSTARAVPESVRHAKTDLYDTGRRSFYIQYPAWFVVVLALAGVVAFAVTGFLGYTKAPVHSSVDDAFSSPWVLYLWLSILMITLVASVLRDASLRARLFAMLLVSLVAVVFIGVTRFQNILPDIIRQLLGQHVIFQALSRAPATYTIVNFGLIGIFWADTIRRWVRYSRGVPLYPSVDIGLPESERGGDPRKDLTFSELISGDLLAGSLLAILLFGIFRIEVLGLIIHPQGGITTCTLSWPFGSCAHGATITDPPTLAFMDLLQALFYLPLGLIILALSAMLSGLGAVHAVDNLDLALASTSISSQSSTAPITEDVTLTLFKALRSAVGRRGRSLAGNFVLSLRWVGWPALLFVGAYGISELSFDVQQYLHSLKTLSEAATYILPAAGWGLAAILSIVVSIALMLFRFRVVENTLRFVGLIGLVALLTFWLFSLALWGVNQLVYQFNVQLRAPFDPPGASTLASLAALLIFGLLLLVNNARRPKAAPPSAAPAGGAVPASQLTYAQNADATSAQAAPVRANPPTTSATDSTSH
jgi:hypothetical protein